MIPGKQYRPEDILRIAWRRKWLIAAPFFVVAIATAAVARYLPNKYRSETLIMVIPQRVPESYVRSTVTMRIEDRLQSISQQILSRPRLERIIQDFNLYPVQRKTAIMEDLVERMRQQEIEVQVVKGDSFRVRYVADDPRTAMRVVERLASLFIEENLRDREVMAEGTNQFLEAQLEDARRRLVEHEQKLSQYQREHSDELPSQVTFNLQGQHNAEMQVQALVDSLSADRDRRLLLERQIADASVRAFDESAPIKAGDQAAPEGTAQQLAAARSALAALEARLTPAHPDVVRAKRVIAELERTLAAEAKESGLPVDSIGKSPAQAARENRVTELRLELTNLTRQVAAKEEQEKQLRATVAQYQSRIRAAPVRASELAELTRDYDTLQQMYRNLLQKNEDSKISANLERRQIGEQFKIVEPAQLPEKPFSPDRVRIDLIGAVLGIALGIGMAVLLEYMDTTIRSEADVVIALKVPVLARVPLIEGEDEQRRQRKLRLMWGLTAAASVALALAGLLWKMRA
jgi:polysaccharide chain length determinant protein (PEP-CTERM system associated)